MLGASLVFYAVLSWQAYRAGLHQAFLVWWCGRRTAAKGIFYTGWRPRFSAAAAQYLPAALGGRASWPTRWASATLRCSLLPISVRRGKLLPGGKYLRLLCYASFFLHHAGSGLTAMMRLMPQMDRPARWDTARVWRGVQRSAWGYLKSWQWLTVPLWWMRCLRTPPPMTAPSFCWGRAVYSAALRGFLGHTDIVLASVRCWA